MLQWFKQMFAKMEQPELPSISKASKKETEYANLMHSYEDHYDRLDETDFGEAYNFHMDCGDR